MNFGSDAKRCLLMLSLFSAFAFLPAIDALAQSSGPARPRRLARTVEDERDPVVFARNLRSLADRTIALGAAVGFSPETIEQIAELQRELDTTGASELAAAAEQMGPHIARMERALSRIVIAPGTPEEQPVVSFDDPPDPGGAWHSELGVINAAPYPTGFGIDVQSEAQGQGNTNTSAKVCDNHPELGCEDDDDCPDDDTCIDRPTGTSVSQEVEITRTCVIRPLDASLKALGEISADVEAAKIVMNRICNQVIWGFNASLACIISDLVALTQERVLATEITCKQLWAEAESRSSYSRLAHIKEKEEALKADAEELKAKSDTIKTSMLSEFVDTAYQIDAFQSDASTKFVTANTNIDDTRAVINTSIVNARDLINANIDSTRNLVNTNVGDTRTLLNTNIDTTRTLLDTNIDDTRALLDANINNTRTLLDTNIDDTRTVLVTRIDLARAALEGQATAQSDLFLRAELERALLHRERLAIYYLPESQGGYLGRIRQIVEETINRVEASRETTNQARTQLGYAVADLNAGRFKRAFSYLSSAYFEATKTVGEQQSP